MCGIIGIISKATPVTPLIVEALKRLEYRGYDSAGIATLNNGSITRARAEGKITNLEKTLLEHPLYGTVGIGHTRWATHGIPSENNAHPHATEKVAVVHNGIIENFASLKAELIAKGHKFTSETDTEVVAHLLTDLLNQGHTPEQAMAATIKRLQGAFALAVLFAGHEDMLMGARRGSPLVVGYGEGAMYLGSDALALAPLTQRISYLQEDDWVIIHQDSVTIFDTTGTQVQREIVFSGLTGAMIGKGRHRHYMQKEIYEQPTVLGDTLQAFLNPADSTLRLPAMPFALTDFDDVSIIACGTSFHAGVVAKYWFEQIAGLRTRVDIASEYRYRPFVESPRTLCLFISQSGETADTLAALKFAKENGQKTLAIVNVPSSTMAREADSVLVTLAGPEIGVASTKAFTTQLLVLAVLAIRFAVERQKISAADAAVYTNALLKLPEQCSTVLKLNNDFLVIAQEMMHARDVLFIGRGGQYPIALEGALKLKELSYIHAEGLAAGELKHGSIALIDEAVPIVALAPKDALFEKSASNIQEIIARKGKVILLSDKEGLAAFAAEGSKLLASIELPTVHSFAAPIIYTLPVQFLAYHIAVLKGTDVDQPRNLAKSVTVE